MHLPYVLLVRMDCSVSSPMLNSVYHILNLDLFLFCSLSFPWQFSPLSFKTIFKISTGTLPQSYKYIAIYPILKKTLSLNLPSLLKPSPNFFSSFEKKAICHMTNKSTSISLATTTISFLHHHSTVTGI